MTRTTVYKGAPWDDENNVLADLFHDSDTRKPVRIIAADGQEIHFDEDEWVDIYIDGELVDE